MTEKKREQGHDVRYWGVFPYRWNWKKIFYNLWNEKDDRIFFYATPLVTPLAPR